MCVVLLCAIDLSVPLQTLKSCSENFPIQNYTIRVSNLTSEFTIPSISLPLPGGEVSLQLNNTVLPDLKTDMVYSVSVNVCSDFSCKESEPVTLCECLRAHVRALVSVVSLLRLVQDYFRTTLGGWWGEDKCIVSKSYWAHNIMYIEVLCTNKIVMYAWFTPYYI